MFSPQIIFHALVLSLLTRFGNAKIAVPNCSCGALSTFYTNHRFGCECFRKQPMTNQSVFPASSLPINLTTLYVGVQDDDCESFRTPDCQADKSSYSYLGADTMRLWEGTNLQFISFSNFDFAKGRAKRISPWLENVKSTLAEMEIVCGRLVTLATGVFVGFSNLTKLTITGTHLEHLEPGAFSELRSEGKSILTKLDLSYHSVWLLDWAVLQPVAASLQSFLMTNGAVMVMRASLESFPELRRIDLAYNTIPVIPKTVVKTWPKSSQLAVNLKNNSLCRYDSLCRCCGLLPLLRFANESNAWIFMECGDLESKEILNETTFLSVSQSQTSICTEQYHTSITAGDFLEVLNSSLFERCNEDEEPNVEVTLCTVVVGSGSSHISLYEISSHLIRFALTLTLILSD